MQFLSFEMCQHLSSLAPGFEGHWKYYRNVAGSMVSCLSDRFIPHTWKYICPAWQVEDVLRNLKVVLGEKEYPPFIIKNQLINFICDLDAVTAYQKIEEYLWEILK